jgi:hypothetical protein
MSIRVMSWVFDESDVQHRGDLLVLLVLADHASDDGDHAYPSVETIAKKARLTDRGARLALRNLEASGAIEKTGKGPRGTFAYRVVMDPQARKSLPPAITAPRKSATEGGKSVTSNVQATSPEPSKPSKEPSSRAGRPSLVAVSPDTPPPVRHNGKAVPPGRLAVAEQLLLKFNAAAGTNYRARTGTGKPSDALSRILTALVDYPEITAEVGERMITARFAEPYWTGNPLPGVVFGPRVVQGSLQAASNTRPTETASEFAARFNAVHERATARGNAS